MIAILVMTVGLLGLLKAVEVATFTNLKNQMRDEGIQMAEGEMNHWRAMPFGTISTCLTAPSNPACSGTPATYRYAALPVKSTLRGVGKIYSVNRSTVVTSDGTAVDLGVRVTWPFKNISTSHEVHTVRGL
jgi:type IV pilus assembly protein PilV